MTDHEETTRVTCPVCFRHCRLAEGEVGNCRARTAVGGQVVAGNYGQVTALAMDPIEKKPLARFHPGEYILSVGSYGCNLHCPFCQNYEIAQAGLGEVGTRYISPAELRDIAVFERDRVPQGNLGVAFTYNEPLVGYEYVRDTAKLIHEAGMLNVVVTNGSVCQGPLREVLPYIDAMNIDLKGFSEDHYRWLSGDLETVQDFIRTSFAAGIHIELTSLIIPGRNDGPAEMKKMAKWIAAMSPDIPLHVNRAHPDYKMPAMEPTPRLTVLDLADVAREHLKYVFCGNM